MCQNDHSLSPWHAEITTIDMCTDYGRRYVCSTVQEAKYFTEFMDLTIDGHNFKFDWLFLAVHGWEIPLERWVGDSSIAAYVMTEKIPDHWLAEYDEQRKSKGSHHRKAGKS